MVQVYDGPECGWTEHDDPDLADGSLRTLEEADEYPLSHPHCQRAFGPVVLTEPSRGASRARARERGAGPRTRGRTRARGGRRSRRWSSSSLPSRRPCRWSRSVPREDLPDAVAPPRGRPGGPDPGGDRTRRPSSRPAATGRTSPPGEHEGRHGRPVAMPLGQTVDTRSARPSSSSRRRRTTWSSRPGIGPPASLRRSSPRVASRASSRRASPGGR